MRGRKSLFGYKTINSFIEKLEFNLHIFSKDNEKERP